MISRHFQIGCVWFAHFGPLSQYTANYYPTFCLVHFLRKQHLVNKFHRKSNLLPANPHRKQIVFPRASNRVPIPTAQISSHAYPVRHVATPATVAVQAHKLSSIDTYTTITSGRGHHAVPAAGRRPPIPLSVWCPSLDPNDCILLSLAVHSFSWPSISSPSDLCSKLSITLPGVDEPN
jgi:hypothetical protein